jgi:hypothetical protein
MEFVESRKGEVSEMFKSCTTAFKREILNGKPFNVKYALRACVINCASHGIFAFGKYVF